MNLSFKLDMNLIKAGLIAALIVENFGLVADKVANIKLSPTMEALGGGGAGFLVGALMNDNKIKTLAVAFAGVKIANNMVQEYLAPEITKTGVATEAKVLNLQDYGYISPVGDYVNLPSQNNAFQQYYFN